MPKTAHVKLPCVPTIGVFFDGCNFFAFCAGQYDFMDVVTYTCQHYHKGPTVRRMIVGVSHLSKRTEIGISPTAGYKTYAGLHTKLYLGYRKGRLIDAFVGSQNLVSPTLAEVIVRTNQEQREYLARYFDELWNNPKVKLNK